MDLLWGALSIILPWMRPFMDLVLKAQIGNVSPSKFGLDFVYLKCSKHNSAMYHRPNLAWTLFRLVWYGPRVRPKKMSGTEDAEHCNQTRRNQYTNGFYRVYSPPPRGSYHVLGVVPDCELTLTIKARNTTSGSPQQSPAGGRTQIQM